MNLFWYAQQWYNAYQQKDAISDQPGPSSACKPLGPQDLDYNLAAYCVVSGVASLDTGKWKDLFPKQKKCKESVDGDADQEKNKDKKKKDRNTSNMDKEVKEAFERMRQLYVTVKPSDAPNYQNKILNYFIRLFDVKFVIRVTYTLLFHLLGKLF